MHQYFFPEEWREFADVHKDLSIDNYETALQAFHFDSFFAKMKTRIVNPIMLVIVIINTYAKPANTGYSVVYYWILTALATIFTSCYYDFVSSVKRKAESENNVVHLCETNLSDLLKMLIEKKFVYSIKVSGNNLWIIIMELMRCIGYCLQVTLSYIILTRDCPVYLFVIVNLCVGLNGVGLITQFSIPVLFLINVVPVWTIFNMLFFGCSAVQVGSIGLTMLVIQCTVIMKMVYISEYHRYELTTEKQIMLQKSEKMYKKLYHEAPSLFLSVMHNGHVVNCNQSTINLTGYTHYELTHQITVFDLFTKKSKIDLQNCVMKLTTSDDNISMAQLDLQLISKCGMIHDVTMCCSVIRHRSDKNIYLLNIVLHDITDQKRLQEELIRAKEIAETASRTKSEFLATMSHEIRSPLVSICGMTELLLKDSEALSSIQSDYLKTIRCSASVLKNLINDILDISKIESGKLVLDEQGFCLHDTVEIVTRCVFESIAKEKGVRYKLDMDEFLGEKHLVGDFHRLNQVLINLTNNAVKFTPSQGEVSVTITSLDALQITDSSSYLSTELRNQVIDNTMYPESGKIALVFVVSDTGVGIPRHRMPDLFQKFTQLSRCSGQLSREFSGTGLGLTISKSLVQMMGGQFFVTSQEDVGSTFVFTAVFKEERKRFIRRRSIVPELPSEVLKWNFLVAEDNIINQKVITNMLKKLGIPLKSITIAENGLRAVELVEESLSNSKKRKFDVIMTDISMPLLDGIEASRRIREISGCEELPILALTANASDTCKQACIEAGMDGFCPKPYSISSIVALLTNVFDEKYGKLAV